jgi:hypothetical protein
MASIYESPGQQVELTGFQSTSSTPLVQAYDPSGIMLQQSEKDLEALALRWEHTEVDSVKQSKH